MIEATVLVMPPNGVFRGTDGRTRQGSSGEVFFATSEHPLVLNMIEFTGNISVTTSDSADVTAVAAQLKTEVEAHIKTATERDRAIDALKLSEQFVANLSAAAKETRDKLEAAIAERYQAVRDRDEFVGLCQAMLERCKLLRQVAETAQENTKTLVDLKREADEHITSLAAENARLVSENKRLSARISTLRRLLYGDEPTIQ